MKNIYFLGIGGIGMSALARYFNQLGIAVNGYDKTPTSLTEKQQAEGITIHFDEDPNLIPDELDLVVYTPAIPKEHKGLNYIIEQNIPLYKRSQILGELTKDKFTIAVAGTHGKTTISSMLAHVLHQAGVKVSGLIGGIIKEYETNFIGVVNGDVFVVEADEFDRSFLTLNPDIALISSMDADHLDVYGSKNSLQESFELFAQKIKHSGQLVLKEGLEIDASDLNIKKYSLLDKADFYANHFSIESGNYDLNLKLDDVEINDLKFIAPGRHNVENAIAAASLAKLYGLSVEDIKSGLEFYPGVKRRFEVIVKNEDFIFVDDYAHHPEELKACILSVKELYPEKKVTGVFQPHLFSRTRDLADEFARSLELLDEVVVMDIYPARENPIEGIDAKFLLNKINHKHKYYCNKEDVVKFVNNLKPEVLLTLGAGNIDQIVEPLKQKLS